MSSQDFRIIFPESIPLSLSSEYVDFELWVKSRLGDDFSSVELSPKQIWWILQESDMEWASELHTMYMKNYMSHFYGISQNTNVAGIKPNITFSYLSHMSEGIANMAGIGGTDKDFIGYILTDANVQEYILDGNLLNKDGNAVDFSNGIDIIEVYYNDANSTNRYIDTWSYYNIMAGEFGVKSALYNTMFAMLPVNANVMMMQHVKFNNKLRLSNYSWEMFGNNMLKIYPRPASNRRIYIRYKFKTNINSAISVTGSASGESITGTSGIGNFSQIKLNPIEWSDLNQIAKRWIRKYGLALCKEVLSFNRGKFKQIPFASDNNMVELNWDMLATQSKEEQKELKDQLRADLAEIMNPAEMMKRDAEAMKAHREQLEMIPLFPKWI